MVEVWLPYGDSEVCVRIPTTSLLDVIKPKDVDVPPDPQEEIRSALKNPVEGKSIEDIAKSETKVSIVLKESFLQINRMIICTLIDELRSAGIRDEDVTLIIAHDPFRLSSEHDLPTDTSLSERLRIIWHNHRDGENVYFGSSPSGIKFYLNRNFLEADVKILVGTVEPHPIIGYTGGWELIFPGIADTDSSNEIFKLELDEITMRGRLKDNPVYEEISGAAEKIHVDLALHVVMNGEFKLVKAFAGEVNKSFLEAVKFADSIYRIPVEDRADVVFISPGGSYFDATFQESTLCLDTALDVLGKKKDLILVAECLHGFGDKEFLETILKYPNLRLLRKDLERKFSIPKLMAYRLMNVLQQINLSMVTAMPNYYISKISNLKVARTANEAYRMLIESSRDKGKISFIPYGSLTIPSVK